MIKVWSERESGGWTECTESAYLMALLYGGYTNFPLGVYTDAERDALDEAVGYDLAGGGNTFLDIDIGAKRRYNTVLRNISGESELAFRKRLNAPGHAVALAGSLGYFPKGHYLRRQQPTFVGGHAITVITQGNGGVLWLDPLAPDDHPGDKATVEDVITFAYTDPTYAREALEGEFAPVPVEEEEMVDFSIAGHQIPKIVRIKQGATLYKTPAGNEVHWVATSPFDAELFMGISSRYLGRRAGSNGAFFFGQDAIDPDVPYKLASFTGAEQTQVIADLKTQLAELVAKISQAKAALG